MINWKSIHKGFGKEWYSGKTYQQAWEEAGFAYQEVQTWIQVGFKPNEYHWVKQWKDLHFTSLEVKSWIDICLTKSDYKFVTYLKDRNYQPSSYLNIEQLRKEFVAWKEREKLTQITYQQQQSK